MATLYSLPSVHALGYDGSGNPLTSAGGSINAAITNVVGVTGTFWQTTQPISGTVSISGSTTVTGTVSISGTVATTQSGIWTTRIQGSSGETLSVTSGGLHVNNTQIANKYVLGTPTPYTPNNVTATQIFAANASRKGIIIQNASTRVLFVNVDGTNPTLSVFHLVVPAGTERVITDMNLTGQLKGLLSGLIGSGTFCVTELT